MTQSADASRVPTPVDAIAEDYARAVIATSPMTATYLGLPGHDDELDDFGPAALRAQSDLRRRTTEQLSRATPVDDVDRVTIAAMRERLGLAEEMYAAGLEHSKLNVIDSPLQGIREIIDLMPTDTEEAWANIAGRLHAMPAALGQWHESLREGAERGVVAARRQVTECATQAEGFSRDGGFFDVLVQGATLDGAELPEATRRHVEEGSRRARAAYAETAEHLRTVVLPKAPDVDAVGRDVYALCSRYFLGAQVDLEETYAWGQAELARITAEMEHIATGIVGSPDIDAAISALDDDPRYQLHGVEALQRWMQLTADEAIDAMSAHFEIADPIRRIECRIAPTTDGGIYYTGPSDDFARPGRMWWAVPEDVTRFGTWREKTTVYHEGVPGHHLQVSQAVYRRDVLNTWRRSFAWTSGHGEGWALYAERLMDELGFMSDPGDRMGLLDAQSLRAARVVLDIGFHCGFTPPPGLGDRWTYDVAWRFLKKHAHMADAFLRFELHRYLGWPGQAPSYKVGERLWLDLRRQAEAKGGDAFSLRDFHARALDVGGVGLDVLRDAVLAAH